MTHQAETKVDKLLEEINDARTFLNLATTQVDAVDVDDPSSGDYAVNLADARSELANASNAIDDAMGLIDELMQPEPERDES